MKFPILIISFILVSCSSDKTDYVEFEIEKWKKEGWEFYEIIGIQKPKAKYVAHMSSTTASKVTAFASNNIRKEYQQTDEGFLIVTMRSFPNNRFSLVFKQPIKSNKASEGIIDHHTSWLYNENHH